MRRSAGRPQCRRQGDELLALIAEEEGIRLEVEIDAVQVLAGKDGERGPHECLGMIERLIHRHLAPGAADGDDLQERATAVLEFGEGSKAALRCGCRIQAASRVPGTEAEPVGGREVDVRTAEIDGSGGVDLEEGISQYVDIAQRGVEGCVVLRCARPALSRLPGTGKSG